MSVGWCGVLDVGGSVKGGPLTITILYGTPHSSSRDTTWNIWLGGDSVADHTAIYLLSSER